MPTEKNYENFYNEAEMVWKVCKYNMQDIFTDQEKKIITKYYIFNWEIKSIAKRHKIDRDYLYQIIIKIHHKLSKTNLKLLDFV